MAVAMPCLPTALALEATYRPMTPESSSSDAPQAGRWRQAHMLREPWLEIRPRALEEPGHLVY